MRFRLLSTPETSGSFGLIKTLACTYPKPLKYPPIKATLRSALYEKHNREVFSMRVLLLLISCSWLLAESALSQENTPARVKPDGGMDKDGVYVIVKPERKVAETDRIYEGMTPVKYEPPADRWALLPKTKKKLDQGGQLTIVMLGDSIVNDTSRSNWS